MITIEIPALLTKYAEGKNSLALSVSSGANLLEVIRQLTAQYPSLSRYLLSAEAQLVSFASFYINGQDARMLSQEKTPINDSDTISIILAIAGG